MSRFLNLPLALQRSFEQHSVLKIISGLANFDQSSIESIARSAFIGGADLIDIACDSHLVGAAIKASSIPVCVSAVDPELFPSAVEAGAVMVEIGNFDSFYAKGRCFAAKEVLSITIKTRKLLPNIFLSATVPHHLPLDQQTHLAMQLVDAGADLIQTEGGTSAIPQSPGITGLIEKATPTLASVHSISKGFSMAGCQSHILCASGLTPVTVPMAISIGASGVGVGSAVNGLASDLERIAMIRSLREGIDSSLKVNSCNF